VHPTKESNPARRGWSPASSRRVGHGGG